MVSEEDLWPLMSGQSVSEMGLQNQARTHHTSLSLLSDFRLVPFVIHTAVVADFRILRLRLMIAVGVLGTCKYNRLRFAPLTTHPCLTLGPSSSTAPHHNSSLGSFPNRDKIDSSTDSFHFGTTDFPLPFHSILRFNHATSRNNISNSGPTHLPCSEQFVRKTFARLTIRFHLQMR